MKPALAFACAMTAAGCARASTPPPPVAVGPTQAEWTRAREELAKMREEAPREPYVELIRVTMREPHTGKVIEGRGAVAVDPRRAVRLVLLGPGGRTALDVWVTGDAWRFSVPALDMVRRGQADQPTYDVPVGFFRWWFLEPLDGRLLAIAPARGGGRQFVLRDGKATVVLESLPEAARPAGWSRGSDAVLRHYIAVRREVADPQAMHMDVDRLEWIARALHPAPGDRAYYTQRATGLQIEIQVEALSDDPPDPAAFLDPDAQGLSL